MTALSQALAAIDNAEADPIAAAKAAGLMRGYDARWRDVAWETLSVEETYHLPLINPETGRQSRTFTHAGKFDGIIRYTESGKTYLLEHKTTSEDVADPNSTYWRRLRIDSQVSAYVLASWQDGMKLDGTVFDVIRKPGIRPKNIDKEHLAELLHHGTYYGFELPDKSMRSEKQETPYLYSLRLARDCIENPDKYFQRRTIPRLDSEVLEFGSELWDVGQAIAEARRTNRNFRNSGACLMYGSPCEYLSVCSDEDTIDSDRWQKADSVHSELPTIGGNGLDVLTNSRVRCFMTCRRKHLYRYELGVRRVDEDERESLAFGTLFHEALAAWWLFFKKEDSNGHSGNTVSEAVRSAEGLAEQYQDEGQRAS